MGKITSIILTIFLTLTLLSGCSSDSKYKKAAEEFLKTKYTFEDTDKIAGLDDYEIAADKFAEKIEKYIGKESIDNTPGYKAALYDSVSAGFFHDSVVHPKKISLKRYLKDTKSGIVTYDFTVTVSLVTPDKKEFASADVGGQIQIKNIDDSYRVCNLVFDVNKEWQKLQRPVLAQ